MIRRCFALFIVILAGCCAPRYFSEPGDNIYLMADYDDALDLWTSHDEIHHDLLGVADLNAVYRSWEVRLAYLQTIKNRWNPDQDRIDRAVQREINLNRQGHEFYLGLYCYREEWNRLTGIDPLWHLSLESDSGGPVAPSRIEILELAPDESWIFLRPISHGRKMYRVIFPLTDEFDHPLIDKTTRRFVLTCDSMVGNLTLVWRLGPVPATLQ